MKKLAIGLFFVIAISSCASQKPMGYVYRDGTMQGVNYKKQVSREESYVLTIIAVVCLGLITQ